MKRWKLRLGEHRRVLPVRLLDAPVLVDAPSAEDEANGLLLVGDAVDADRHVRADRVGTRRRLDHVRDHQRERDRALRIVDEPFGRGAVEEDARRLMLDRRLCRRQRRDRVVVRLAHDDAEHRAAAADRDERARERSRVRRRHDRGERARSRLRTLDPGLVVDLRVEVVERRRVRLLAVRRLEHPVAALSEPDLRVARGAGDAVPVQGDDRCLGRLGDGLLHVAAERDRVRVLLLLDVRCEELVDGGRDVARVGRQVARSRSDWRSWPGRNARKAGRARSRRSRQGARATGGGRRREPIFTLSLTAPTSLGMSPTEKELANCSFIAWTNSCCLATR